MRQRRSSKVQEFFEEALLAETDECIIWPYSTSAGYGQIYVHRLGRQDKAHREVLYRKKGPCPPGKETAHLCGNKLCINHRHLERKTHIENELDKIGHGKFTRLNQYGENNLIFGKPSYNRTEIEKIHLARFWIDAGDKDIEIAERLSISKRSIGRIRCNESYYSSIHWQCASGNNPWETNDADSSKERSRGIQSGGGALEGVREAGAV